MDNPLTIQKDRHHLFRLVLLVEGGMALVAILLGYFLELPPYRTWHLEWETLNSVLSGVGPMAAFFMILMRFPLGPLSRIRLFLENVLRPLFQHCRVWDLFWISMLAGVGEEFFFRGLLQPLLSQWWGWKIGLILSSVIFGLAHLITPTYAIITTVISLYLGAIQLATSNIAIPVLIHGTYDFFALWYFLRIVPPRQSPT